MTRWRAMNAGRRLPYFPDQPPKAIFRTGIVKPFDF
ncbi:phage terminase large subunit-like protein [Rhizobium pisi]|uniref:Phage terminase large subunit-like protein n=2 Tax=Rhizobium TaxID=379 RepID=A0A7W6B9P1_9HYPH|nr:phage terminase large subunit-like protein [Rhizobium pisi]MBB3918372.1 phage terminase large subunit-like protein [Rhizobium fabae]